MITLELFAIEAMPFNLSACGINVRISRVGVGIGENQGRAAVLNQAAITGNDAGNGEQCSAYIETQSPRNSTGPTNSALPPVPTLMVVVAPFAMSRKYLFQETVPLANESVAPALTLLVREGSPMFGVNPENSKVPP